jgi:hypothetical protein
MMIVGLQFYSKLFGTCLAVLRARAEPELSSQSWFFLRQLHLLVVENGSISPI